MSRFTHDNRDTASLGREAVVRELQSRGWSSVTESWEGNRCWLAAKRDDGQSSVMILVKTKRTGDWQTSTNEGRPSRPVEHEDTFWIFVDLGRPSAPEFYIAPSWWVRNDIYNNHEEYLARHGGRRARSQDTMHHRIEPARVRQWRGKWDVLVGQGNKLPL